MAGKVQVAKFPGVGFNNYDHSDGHYMNPSPPTTSHWKMEEEESLIDQLYDQSFKKRTEVLEKLLITARRSNGRLQYSNTYSVFHGLEQALTDVSWEVRLKCVQLITELLPNLIEETDTCMTVVLHVLIPQLGDSKPTVRKAVIQCLHVYMKNTSNMHLLLGAVIKYGLEHPEPQICRETIVTLPVLLTHDFSNENFFEIIKSLAKKLLDSTMEQSQDSIVNTLDKVHNLVGDAVFYSYLQKLSPPLRRYYLQLSKKPVLKVEENHQRPAALVLDSRTASPGSYVYTNDDADDDNNICSYEFGIIPTPVMAQIYDQDNFRSRSQAVEELKNILKDLYKLDLLMPHMLSFISFISSLMDDANFKITMATLDIMGILVEKLGSEVKHFLKPLIASITKRMCDNKIVVRQAVMRVAIQMMQCCSAKPVLSVICDNLQHRNSRVRQEAINIIIASLLKFPSYDFDLASLCRTVGPALLDSKRHVRQAALECFAVLAQAMGLGRMQPLIHAVDEVELSVEGEGVMAAVQARLARRQLPKLNVDGLVEYATPLPNSGTRSATGIPQGADIDWILAAASGGSGSARTARSDAMELESVSSRSTPAVPVDPATPVPRRFMSAGRGRSKLPWEEDRDERSGTAPTQVIRAGRADHSPVKPRMTWQGESPDTSRNDQTEYADTARSVNKGGSKRGPGPMKLVNIDSDDKPETYRESWTDREAHRPGKSKLEPIPDDITPPETPLKRPAASVKDAFDDTPVHLAAAMARGSATPHNKVPPITPSTARDADSDRAYSPPEYNTPNDFQMMTSLTRIRNSASKKKAAKLFEKLEKRQSHPGASSQSPSPPGSESLTESGIFSSPSTGREDLSEKTKSNKVPGPFESRPRLARAGSLRDKKGSPGPPSEMDAKIHKPDYNPNSGVTFHANRSSDVQIVGRGYNDDNSPTDNRTMAGNNNIKNRERKRPVKGGSATLSPLGLSSPYSYGSVIDQDDDYELLYLDSGYSSDKIGVVGRGVFESNIYGGDNAGTNGANMNERADWRSSNQGYKSMPSGIYGVGVRQNSTDKDSDQEDIDEDGSNLSVSKTTRERIAIKKQQRQEEVSLQKRTNGLHQYEETEQEVQEQSNKIQRERERQQEKLKHLSQPEPATDGPPPPPATGGNDSVTPSPLSPDKIVTSANASLSGAVPTCFHNAIKTNYSSAVPALESASKQRQANKSLAISTTSSSRFDNLDQASVSSNSDQPITTTTTITNNLSYPKSRVTSTTNLTSITPCTSSSLPPSSEQSFTCSSASNGSYEPSPMFSDEEGSPLVSYITSPAKSPTKPISSITPRKKAKSAITNQSNAASGEHRDSIPLSGSSKSLMTSDNPDDWEPFKDPDSALKEAQKYLAMDDWEQKCHGLNMVRRLAMYNTEVLVAQLHPLTLALLAEVKNLRSQVSRVAIACFVDLFLNARKSMDVDLEMTTKVLLAKNGESNGFIREDVERALTAMVDSVTPQKALLVLITNGATHRNPVVRRTAAQFLVDLVEKMGPGRILSGVKDITDRLLPAAAQFAMDGSPETRYHGRTILHMLMSHHDFDKMLSKHLPANTLRNIKDIVDTLKAKGLGDIPSESASARSRRSGQGSRSGSFRGGSAASSVSAMSDVTKRRVVHTGDQIQEDIKQLNTLLGASDWKDRYKGISQFLEMCESSADLVGTHIIKIFDKFLPRLQDANSKVNLYALQVMLQVVPLLHNWLSSVINLTVQKVAPNLNSKNKDIFTITMDIFDSIMANIDGSLLIQPFADQSQSASPRSKPELIEKVAFLVTRVYPKKHKPVVLHVLPLLWELLSSANTSGIQTGHGSLRVAVVKLVRSLYEVMGHSLVEHAQSSPTLTPRQLQLLKDLIDQ